MLAWWALTSTWSSLRFDDHRGLSPAGVVEHPDCYQMTFLRTKTTGSDKVETVRPGVVSKQAWLRYPGWFARGWSLWRQNAPFPRDYFLCPPADGGKCAHPELKYVEYSGRMRAMLAALPDESGVDLGAQWAMFITPHSFRAFLPTALDSMGASRNWLSWLLSWKGKGSSGYARSGRDKTLTMQKTVADIVREHLGGSDPLGEGSVLLNLRAHLDERGADAAEAKRIINSLSAFPKGGVERVLWPAGDSTRVEAGQPPGSSIGPAVLEEGTAAGGEPEEEQVITGYVISISNKRRIRRLHLVGACYRQPGVDYQEYQVLGDEVPEASEYDDFCRSCWSGGNRPVTLAPAPEESQGSVSSDSESSSSAPSD
jgi:hypothetical protein